MASTFDLNSTVTYDKNGRAIPPTTPSPPPILNDPSVTSDDIPEIVVTASLPQTNTVTQDNTTSTDNLAFSENVLDSYYNYTYHWRFFVVNDQDLINASSPTNIVNYKNYFNTLEANGNLIVIAESGVTGYSIDEVVLRTKSQSNKGGLSTGFEMSISEPFGTSFIEKLAIASASVKNPNFQRTLYCLELTFIAYDVNGIPQPLNTYKLWPVGITSMKTRFDDGITKYDIKLFTIVELGEDRIIANTKKAMKLSAETVSDVFDVLAVKLRPDPGEGQGQNPYVTDNLYDFVFIGEEGEDVGSWKLLQPRDVLVKPDNSAVFPAGGDNITYSGNGNAVNIQIGADVPIDEIIKIVLSCTKEAQNKIGVVDTSVNSGSTDNSSKQSSITDITRNTQQVPKIYRHIEYLDYVVGMADYNKKITYYVTFSDTSNIMFDMNQYISKTSPLEQKRRIQSFGKRLNRKYFFQYTGENTDILDLKLEFDNLYTASFPMLGGKYTLPLVTDGKFLDSNKISVRSNVENLQAQNNKRIQYIDDKIQNINSNPNLTSVQKQNRINTLNQEKSQIQTQNNTIVSQASNSNTSSSNNSTTGQPNVPISGENTSIQTNLALQATQSLSILNQNTNTPGTKYAENLQGDLKNAMDWFNSINQGQKGLIRFSEDEHKYEAEYYMNIETVYDRGRHFMAAALNQVYTPEKDLIAIDMSIRGDPYWLFMDHFEYLQYFNNISSAGGRPKTLTSANPPSNAYLYTGSDGQQYPNGMSSEHLFLLAFNTPEEYNAQGLMPVNQKSYLYENIYMVIEVYSYFREGKFEQKLIAKRDPILTPEAIAAAKDTLLVNPNAYKNGSNSLSGSSSGTGSHTATSGNKNPKPSAQQLAAQRQQAINYFVSQGWTPEQASGIVANLQTESNLDPNAIGDGGKAYGIAQWHPDRQQAFYQYTGTPIQGSTYEQQLSFVNYELQNGSEVGAGNKLASATDANTAGQIVSKYYERPAAQVAQATSRGNLSQNIFNNLG